MHVGAKPARGRVHPVAVVTASSRMSRNSRAGWPTVLHQRAPPCEGCPMFIHPDDRPRRTAARTTLAASLVATRVRPVLPPFQKVTGSRGDDMENAAVDNVAHDGTSYSTPRVDPPAGLASTQMAGAVSPKQTSPDRETTPKKSPGSQSIQPRRFGHGGDGVRSGRRWAGPNGAVQCTRSSIPA